ncbi:hypothetical protein WJX74_001102 [Apatococcus lobatus]|uniref:Uncharacterized protein n=1 Tax=Apatococcus lobatus TaxID=904363 RepID=A0AAW1QX99_9CHLO
MMHSFDAADNLLTGSIPALWWTPRHIQYMHLAANRLSGTIPSPDPGPAASFSTTKDVHSLQVSFRGNQLTGSLPSGLSVKLLVSLDLGSNHLTGSLEGVEELDHLHSLRLDSNNFTGAVPRVSSPFLEVLDLSFNDLSGPLPASLADLVSLSMLMLAGNHFLEGQLTNQFTALSLLSILDISGSGLQHDMNHPNDAGDYLPDWLQLNRTGPLVPTQILQLMCYSVRAADNYIPYLTRIFISPSYFHYQACILHCHPYGLTLLLCSYQVEPADM